MSVFEPTQSKTQAIAEIFMEEAANARVSVQDVFGNNRTRKAVMPRQAAMLRAHLEGYPTTAIGWVSGRDHTTVMHGIDRAKMRAAKARNTSKPGMGIVHAWRIASSKRSRKMKTPIYVTKRDEFRIAVTNAKPGEPVCYFFGMPWTDRPTIAQDAWAMKEQGRVTLVQRRLPPEITSEDDGTTRIKAAKFEYLAIKNAA